MELDIDFSNDDKLLTTFSNYIDLNNIEGEIDYNSSNIQPQEGDILFDENFSLPSNSVLIDKGKKIDSGALQYIFGDISIPSDFECNERVVNDNIDLGAIEFGGREGNYCDSNYSYLDSNFTSRDFNLNIVNDINLTLTCPDGWNLDENRSVCVRDDLNVSYTITPTIDMSSVTRICAEGWHFDENRSTCVRDILSEIYETYGNTDIVEIPIHQGWNLVAVDIDLSKIPGDVSIIWTYSDGNWSAYSPNGQYTQAISDSGFPTISKPLSSNNGTWFLSSRDFNLIYPKPTFDENITSPTPPNLTAKNRGWNLMGTPRQLPAELIQCKEGNISVIWKYFDGEWLLYAPNINPSLYQLMFNTILPNEGFWVKCK